jgi:hypothetical protein
MYNAENGKRKQIKRKEGKTWPDRGLLCCADMLSWYV